MKKENIEESTKKGLKKNAKKKELENLFFKFQRNRTLKEQKRT